MTGFRHNDPSLRHNRIGLRHKRISIRHRDPSLLHLSGGFSPLSLFEGGEAGLWLQMKPPYVYQDSARTTPATSVDDPVAGVVDLSGNENHTTQDSLAARPLLKQDVSGHWYAQSDGVDDFLQLPDGVGISGSNARTCLAVAATSNGGAILSLGYSSSTGERWSVRAANTTTLLRIEISGSGYTSSFDFSSRAVVGAKLDGATLGSHVLYKNSSSEQASGAQSVSTVDADNRLFAAGGFFPIGISEVVLVGRALTDEEIANTVAYLAAQNGVTL